MQDTTRKTLIVGNWKMHLNLHQSSLLLHRLAEKTPVHRGVEAVLMPNLLTLQSLSLQINHRQFKLGAQNCYWRDEGPYTGEISATMLRGLVSYVLVGHSERRHVFHETERDIRHKVQAAVRNGIKPILCVGETAQEHADGETPHVLHDQVVSGLLNITSEEVENLTVAYEPVWAIGTDKAAHPSDVSAAANVIRQNVAALYGKKAATHMRVLYGGSVSASNARAFLDTPGVDGLLVGGASLKADEFTAIVARAFESRQSG
ncbi:MAG TPA: triose-phosphate isomerase [Candidatus Saccharimonadales bacterium]|jgi:triosephosphate isomerase